MPPRSPFLERPASEHVAGNALAFAIPDGFPVSPGHTLVVTRRLVPTWFEATSEEQAAVRTFGVVAGAYRGLPDGVRLWAGGERFRRLEIADLPRVAAFARGLLAA